jgi:hypothetical protein
LPGSEVADSSVETLAVAEPQAAPESQVIAQAESAVASEPATEPSIEPIAEPAAEPASQPVSTPEPAEAMALAAPSTDALPQRPPRNKTGKLQGRHLQRIGPAELRGAQQQITHHPQG